MYVTSCYANQRLCIKIQNESPTTTSMSSYIDSSEEVSSWRATTTTSRVPRDRRTDGDTLSTYDDDIETPRGCGCYDDATLVRTIMARIPLHRNSSYIIYFHVLIIYLTLSLLVIRCAGHGICIFQRPISALCR